MRKLTSVLLIAALFAATVSWGAEPAPSSVVGKEPQAEGAGCPKQRGPRRTGAPPAEAQAACTGKASGSACQFEGPPGLETGTCESTPDGKFFGCKPADRPGV